MGIETLNEDLELNIPMFDDDMDIIAKLDDEPNAVGGLTAAELKAEFDRPGKTIQKYLNEILVPSLIGTVAEESVRAQNEYIRVTNENQRVANENGRVEEEERRNTAELERIENEDSRGDNETKRVQAETARAAAEAQRESAEQAREDKTSGIVAQATEQANEAKNQADRAEEQAKKAGDEADRAAEQANLARQVKSMQAEATTLSAGSEATAKVEEENGDLVLRVGIPVGRDGKDGLQGPVGPAGADGVSPVATVESITGGHRVTITDADGPKSFNVMDGKDGSGTGGGSGGGVSKASELDNDVPFVSATAQTLTEEQQEQARANIGVTRPDWNAAEGEPGHVLNRTHWYDVEEDVFFAGSVSIASYTYMNRNMEDAPPFALGDAYTVNWEGVTYECVCKAGTYNGFNFLGVGNMGFVGGEASNEPFAIGVVEGFGWAVFAMVPNGDYNLIVAGYKRIYHTIPPEYIGGSKPYYIDLVNIEDNLHMNYVTKATQVDVQNALLAGYQVVVRRAYSRYNLFDFFTMDTRRNDKEMVFYRIYSRYDDTSTCETLRFKPNDETGGYDIEHIERELVTSEDSLKNPYALTINGTTYDGSKAVTVNIPKGDKGEPGQRGTGLLAVTTGPSSYTTAVGGITPKYRLAISTIKSQASVTEVLLGDTVRYSYYHYPIAYLDGSYAYFTTRVSIRGATGAAGSDATVTKANIEAALGYTPVSPDDIPEAGNNIPDYVRTEAERVAAVVQSRQNENTVTAILSSDYHLPAPGSTYYAQILESITHAGQAMDILRGQLSIDFEAKLGDLIWDNGETQAEAMENFQLVHSLVSEGNILDRWEGNGNHDHLQSNATPFTDAQVYANIGIYNKGCVRDPARRVGGYCYKDYEEFKLRVVLLNTSEANDGSFALSSAQVAWLEEALSVPVEDGWGTLILSHHPLDWGGSNTAVMKKIKAASGILANLHGHVHTFTQDVITGTEIPRLAIPNVCFYRNNEYGTNGGAENSEGIEFGTTTTYNKTAKSGNDTSFCILTLDRAAGKLYLDCYGAGIDREDDVPTWGKKGYTNLVPTSQAADSTEPYNGTGYKNGYYLSSSSPFESADSETVLTGYIPYVVNDSGVPGTIYIKGAEWAAISHCRMFFFRDTKADIVGPQINGAGSGNGALSTFFTVDTLGENYYRLTPIPNSSGNWVAIGLVATVANAEYLRLSLKGNGANLIVTVNEPIE